MERAASQVFQRIHAKLNGAKISIKIFCGIGNNGGDGLAIGRMLIEKGYDVTIYVTNCSKKRSDDFLVNYRRIKELTKDWPILLSCKDDFPEISGSDFVIDAIFGMGLNRSLDGWMAMLAKMINQSGAFIVSVDMPSGLFANEPQPEDSAIINAHHTYTFQTPKMAFFLPWSSQFVGSYEVLDIGLDPTTMVELKPFAYLINSVNSRSIYRPRPHHSYKNQYGHVLVAAGSRGKAGAAVLATTAAVNMGAGLVTAYVPESVEPHIHNHVAEAMVLVSGNETMEHFKHDLEGTTLCIGPGLGKSEETVSAFAKAIKSYSTPIVIDADGLNILADQPELLKELPKDSILTPHDGELKRLVGEWENDYDRIQHAQKLAADHQLIIVLKGAHTMVVDGVSIYANDSGNPGMATGGTGDVLTGVIASLLAQAYPAEAAAVFGVYLHGRAGDLVAQTYGFEGVNASLISGYLGSALQSLLRPQKPQTNEQNK